ncbi:MAG: UDP-2,3-diacylglucosamine diphosphatase LpxI [Candidatus Omnitrophica bacterium]|nr:UDP-2,3-diacylglucosamine diphosphatase LpxI [Candidatus Omnitrophota bacterium]
MLKKTKLGIIAGNRLLPLMLAQKIKEKNRDCEVVAFCFKGQTSKRISRYADKCYWLSVGALSDLRKALESQKLSRCIMAGQINPLYIFRKSHWDQELTSLLSCTGDFRPHAIFGKIINYLEETGVEFLDSTLYLKEDLAKLGVMNGLDLNKDTAKNIDFGLGVISKFVELDVGQTIGVKGGSVVALESLEGTDGAIKRVYRLAGKGCVILKFCKANQDLRFDVPVVGIATLKLLKRIGAAALVLEENKVIILERNKFLLLAKKWGIPIVGKSRKTASGLSSI